MNFIYFRLVEFEGVFQIFKQVVGYQGLERRGENLDEDMKNFGVIDRVK